MCNETTARPRRGQSDPRANRRHPCLQTEGPLHACMLPCAAKIANLTLQSTILTLKSAILTLESANLAVEIANLAWVLTKNLIWGKKPEPRPVGQPNTGRIRRRGVRKVEPAAGGGCGKKCRRTLRVQLPMGHWEYIHATGRAPPYTTGVTSKYELVYKQSPVQARVPSGPREGEWSSDPDEGCQGGRGDKRPG